MSMKRTEVVWVEARGGYSIADVADLSGLPTSVLDVLVECGALVGDRPAATVRFETEHVILARAATRLREHFELDDNGLAVAISLLRRVRLLEARLALRSDPDDEGR